MPTIPWVVAKDFLTVTSQETRWQWPGPQGLKMDVAPCMPSSQECTHKG